MSSPLVTPACVMTSRTLLVCRGMSAALKGTPPNHAGKGLHLLRGWMGDSSGAPRVNGVAYRGRAGAEPVLLNLCPWCGASLLRDDVYEAGAPAGATR